MELSGPYEIAAFYDDTLVDNIQIRNAVETGADRLNFPSWAENLRFPWDGAGPYLGARIGGPDVYSCQHATYWPQTTGPITHCEAYLITSVMRVYWTPVQCNSGQVFPTSLVLWFRDSSTGQLMPIVAQDGIVGTLYLHGVRPSCAQNIIDVFWPEEEEEEEQEEEDDGEGSDPGISGPAFGVELEMLCSTERLEKMLRRERVDIDASMNYTHVRKPYWKMVPDASLPSDGVELVSPVLRPDDAPDQLARVAKALNAAGARVNTQCGYHVHHNADYLSSDQIESLVRAYANSQDLFDSILPQSRRENGMCAHLEDYHLTELRERLSPIRDRKPTRPRDLWDSLRSRYLVVNLESLARHGTVEFRQHSGTTQLRKITEWYKLTEAMVHTAANDQDFPTTPDIGDYVHGLGLPGSSTFYWRGRARLFDRTGGSDPESES